MAAPGFGRQSWPTRREGPSVTGITHGSHIRSYLEVRHGSLTSNPPLRARRDRDGRRAGDHRRSLAARFRPGGYGARLRDRGASARPRRSSGGPRAHDSAFGPRGIRLRAGGCRGSLRYGDRDRHRRVGPRSLFGRHWRRIGGADRIDAVQRPRRRLRSRPPPKNRTHHTYISLLPVPQNTPLRRGVLLVGSGILRGDDAGGLLSVGVAIAVGAAIGLALGILVSVTTD